MIYTVRLPPETKEKLEHVVRLQMALLTYAVSNDKLERHGLISYLKTQPQFVLIAEKVVDALCRTTDDRDSSVKWEMLESFSSDTSGMEFLDEPKGEKLRKEKQYIVHLMRLDVDSLFAQDAGTSGLLFYMPDDPELLPPNLVATKAYLQAQIKAKIRKECKFPTWLCALRKFLISYYELLGTSLSKDYFADGQGYDRQDLLNAFLLENPGHYVCAICDEHSFRTVYSGHQLSDLEHYFPKSVYPHLACHPYNLIPICGDCNGLHNAQDPLWDKQNQRRRTLGQIFLPYRTPSINTSTVMSILLEDTVQEAISFHVIDPSQQAEMQSKIQTLGEIYRIPNRWQEKREEIGDHLWRRIRHFLADDLTTTDDLDNPRFLQRKLHRLLAFMSEDRGKDPLTFPMLWRFAQMLADEVDQVVEGKLAESNSPFLQEIQGWIAYDRARLSQLETISDDLRKKSSEARKRAII